MNESSKFYQRDFKDLSTDEIEAMIIEKKSILISLDSEKRDLQTERKEQVHIVKALRSAVIGIEKSGSGRKKLLGEFHSMRKLAKTHREKRDEINERIPPPSKILEEWLGETYLKLTKIDNDLTTVPMLNPELSAFSRFFEIQSSIKRKREAEKAHSEYISKLTEMRKISTKLDQNKEEIGKAKSDLKENAEIEVDKISRKDIRKISRSISSIDERIEAIKFEINSERGLLKKLQKYSRLSAVRGSSSIDDIRGIAAKGGYLSSEELGLILETGGFSSINDSKDSTQEAPKQARLPKKRTRKLGVSRRGGRKGKSASRRD
jgi:predicted  nucleic acid-binding Zn-ribbon protein